jgi:hypothetical protein
MKVTLKSDLFTAHDNDALNRLWYTIEGQHELFLDDAVDIDALKKSSWYKSLSKSVSDVICDFIAMSLDDKRTNRVVLVCSELINAEAFYLEEALSYLRQPFMILLENSNNDAYFLDCLFRHFPEESRKIKKHKDERWLQYANAGGAANMQNFIDRELKSYDGEKFHKDSYKYLRIFVLIDSDKRYPTEEIRNDKKNLINYLSRFGIPYHVLEKREMENYLPDAAFDDITDNRPFIDAYLRLSAIQKDYFDLEKGFHNKPFNRLDQQIQDLYNQVSDEDKQTFRTKDLTKFGGNLKAEFPKLFDSSRVMKARLLARCSHHSRNEDEHPCDPLELPNLLKKITGYL